MNFYLIAFALGIACLVAVEAAPTDTDGVLDLSQVATDEKEIRFLNGKKKFYGPFCILFRDEVLEDVKGSSIAVTQDLFVIFFAKSRLFKTSTINKNVKTLCELIENYQTKLDGMYKSTRDPMSNLYTGEAEFKLEDINCRTVRKVRDATQYCKAIENVEFYHDKVVNFVKGN